MDNEAIAILLAETDREVQQALVEQISSDDLLQAATARLQTESQIARSLLRLIANDNPQAAYLLAQTYAQTGQFALAQPLIEQARTQFIANGDAVAAARTSVGQMMVLGALGQHNEALAAGDEAREALGDAAPLIQGKLLQNQGLIHEQRGDFTAALASYDAADRAYQQGNFAAERSDILKNRGITLLSIGSAHDALAAFEQASALVDEADQPLRRGRTLANVGYAQQLLGNYSESLETTQSARDLLQAHGFEQYALAVQIDSADLYLTLNRTTDAIIAYTTACAGLQQFGMSYHIARGLFGWGVALSAAGQFSEAAIKLAEAKAAFAELDNQAFVQRLAVEEASLQFRQGDREGALASVTTLLEQENLSDMTRIVAHLLQFDVADSVTMRHEALAAAAEITARLPLPHLRYRLLQRQGTLAVASGNVASAENYFQQAITIIETLRGNLQQEALRISFLDDRLTAHRELLRLLLDQGRDDEAWQLGEEIKSRTLTEAQRRDQTGIAIPTEAQALRQELDALYNTLLDEQGMARRTHSHAVLRDRMIELERALEQQHRPLIPPRPVAAFASDETTASITYHLLGEELLAFVQVENTRHLVRAIADVAAITEAMEEWEVQLRWMRGGQIVLARRTEQLIHSAKLALQQLYELVFAPLRSLVADFPELLIVPTGILHQLPFHALFDGERYLIEQFTLRYAPSVTVDQLARKAETPRYDHVAAFGVDDPALSHVAAETTAITQHFSKAERFHNATATRRAVIECAAPVLHFATHGIFRSEHPLFSGVRLHDGWLTAHDVTRLDLSNRLIVLSACESGRARLMAGDEVLGLPHAFLGAGARSVVASYWLVQDEISAELMPIFYQHLQQTKEPAKALRTAQLAMLSTRLHPYFWANFVLVGGNVR